ncbi:MAG: hypothetical protein AAFW00_22425, partial [Bacteroidota bacterium]
QEQPLLPEPQHQRDVGAGQKITRRVGIHSWRNSQHTLMRKAMPTKSLPHNNIFSFQDYSHLCSPLK